MPEAGTQPAIKKSAELSIIDVLSKARANDSKLLVNTYLSIDDSERNFKLISLKSDKPRSGPASRQRILPQDIPSSSPSSDLIAAEIANNQKQCDSLPIRTPSPRQDFATSLLRFSPSKSSVNPIEKNATRNSVAYNHLSSQYRFEEILHSTSTNNSSDTWHSNDATALHSVSLPKSVCSIESKSMQNASRASSGWSQCQQKISKITDHLQTKSPSKGKLVEKSKSFRLYTKNDSKSIQSSADFKAFAGNMPSLPDLTKNATRTSRHATLNRDSLQSLRFLHYRDGSTLCGNNGKCIPTRSSSSSRVSDNQIANSNRFEIHDFSLVPKTKTMSTSITSDEIAAHGLEKNGIATITDSGSQSILLTSKATPSHSSHPIQNQNIHEIEDNIDKIMKSSFVTVLKKSPTVDLYQIKRNTSASNVSLTTITNVKEEDNAMIQSLNTASVEHPPLIRHSMTATKLDIPLSALPKKNEIVPEFMQIQLNRIDANRPKSYGEYTSNTGTATTTNDDDKERRFSNESIEISDKKKVAIVTLPTSVFGSNQNLNKSTESIKSGFSRHSRISNSSQQLSHASSISDINKSLTIDNHNNSDECIYINSFDDGSSGFPLNVEPNIIIERRKSVSDKKLKFEKKIEEIQAEVKRSSIIGIDKNVSSTSRKSSIEDENNLVVLRSKKSLPSLSSKSDESDDPTPELMKVFARRSLKIKDTDDYLVYDDSERDALNRKLDPSDNTNNNVNNSKNIIKNPLDSDKENHKASATFIVDEELTPGHAVPTVEIHIKTLPVADFDIREKCEIFKKDTKIVDTEASVTNRKSFISNKSFAVPANRFGNSTVTSNNSRNTSAFFENRNSANTMLKKTVLMVDLSPPNNGGVFFIQNEHTKNQTINNIDATKQNSILINSTNNNNNNNLAKTKSNHLNAIRHTIAGSTADDPMSTSHANDNDNRDDNEIEFKGISERKAEWEKRANQAFK